jgi:hypothetical protein
MRTLSWHLRQRSTAGRIGIYFALSALASLIAWVLDIGRSGGIFLAATALVAVDVAIWLRNNPTQKQIERRRLKNADGAARPDE